MNSDSISEKPSARITTQVMWRVNSLVESFRKIHGRKAMMVVTTPKITGLATSIVPSTAALMLSVVSCPLLWMPSPTTMASSTTIPSTSRKAKVDSIFNDTPTVGNNTNAPA